MDLAQFKCLNIDKIHYMSLSEVQYYIEEGNKLLAKMTAYDPKMWEVMDALHNAAQALRG